MQRIEERNLFYVAPFFLIALLLWARLGAPRRLPWAAVVAIGSGALVAVIPFARFIGLSATSDTFALLPWWKLQEHVITLHQVRPVATACALAAGALFLLVPRRWALVLPLLVLVYFAAEQRPIESRTTLASRGALFQGIRSVRPDWIDHAVGRHADVAAIWTGKPDVHVIWENEFFNRSVGPILDTGAAIPGGLPSTAVTIDPRHGPLPRRREAGAPPLRARRLLARAEREGRRLGPGARDLAVPAERAAAVDDERDGPVPERHVVGPASRLHAPRLRRRRGSGDGARRPDPLQAPQRVTANGRVHLVRRGKQTTPDGAAAGTAVRSSRSAPTRVPGNGDPRPLGIHFLGFKYVP